MFHLPGCLLQNGSKLMVKAKVLRVSYPSCSTKITSNNSNIRTHRNEILAAWHVFKRNKTRTHPMARRSEGGILHSVCGTNPSHWYETKTQCTSLRCSSLFTRNTLKPKTCSSCIFSTAVLIYTDLTYPYPFQLILVIYPIIHVFPRNSIHPYPCDFLLRQSSIHNQRQLFHQSAMALCSVAPLTPGFCDPSEGWSIAAAAEESQGIRVTRSPWGISVKN